VNQQKELSLSMEPRPISWKKWVAAFFFFVLFCAALLAISRGTPRLAQVEILILYLLYMSVAFTFLPLPTAWIVLWAAREVEPLSVAVIGTIGTCIANLHDYYIIHYLFRVERIKSAKRTRFYKKAVEWFARAPFATLTVASFLPIPVDVIRILAVSADYPRTRYALATFAGRLPRYLLLAFLGYELQLSNRAIFVVFLVTAAIGLVKGISKLRDRARYRDGTTESHGPE
jgi:membrane protein YqaA with SNARE-associated domain